MVYKVMNNTIKCDALNLLNATNKQLLVVHNQTHKFIVKGFRAAGPYKDTK